MSLRAPKGRSNLGSEIASSPPKADPRNDGIAKVSFGTLGLSSACQLLSRRIVLFVGVLLLLAGCATFRVVEVGSGVDERGIVSRFYGVARNNVLIPEYVVDVYGSYPTTEEEAERRFDVTHYTVEPYVLEKYILPNEFLYQLGRISWGSGFVLVSPIVLPIEWLGEAFGGPQRRSFGAVMRDYFRSAFNERSYKKPKIRETVDNF